jgi:hypothetical protein
MLTFRAFPLGFILKMRNPEKVTPNLLGNGRRILVDSAGNLREIFPTADTMFNGSTISKGKVFFVSSSFRRHK